MSWENMKQKGNMGVMDIIEEGKEGKKERKRRAEPAWWETRTDKWGTTVQKVVESSIN